MEKWPQELLWKLIKGKHIIRLVQGYWNGILLDMCIETIFIRIEKGSGGIVRVILKQGVVKKRVNSLHICTEILKDLNKMQDQEICKYLEFHKEEAKDWIKWRRIPRWPERHTEKLHNPLDTDMYSYWTLTLESRFEITRLSTMSSKTTLEPGNLGSSSQNLDRLKYSIQSWFISVWCAYWAQGKLLLKMFLSMNCLQSCCLYLGYIIAN